MDRLSGSPHAGISDFGASSAVDRTEPSFRDRRPAAPRRIDLTGHRILVVEDDYYLATDTARALEGAGAEVIGPCPSQDCALVEIEARRPTAAVLDINLGDGPTFEIGLALKRRGIPFIYLTGYDIAVIPPDLRAFWLQKPVEPTQIVRLLSGAVAPRS